MTEWASKMSAAENPAIGTGSSAPVTLVFEDEALVDRCRKGDMQAFGLLVAKYQDRILNMIHRMCGRWADAEELAQETFLKALERIGQFRGSSGFYTWLFRIAANLTISHRRRAGRINFNSLSGPDDMDGTQADALTAELSARRNPAPHAAAEAAEEHRRVYEALEGLEDDFRLVVVLRDIEEMDYSQIAKVLELPVGTVKSRLHRARCMLKEKLGPPIN